MPRYALTLAYDGTDFAGWQRQTRPGEGESGPRVELRTACGVTEQAVRGVLREEVTLQGASRTDAGVHANAQCAVFTSEPDPERGVGWPAERGTEALARAINSRLPADLLVVSAREVAPHFNPIADCTSKGYTYRLHVFDPERPRRPLWTSRYVTQCWARLNPEAMQRAADHLVGEHDFASFTAAGHGREHTVRTVLSCRVRTHTPADGELTDAGTRIDIDVSGTGFLYNMVRIVAGTLMDAGRGRLDPDDVAGIIAARDRRRAGPTLPPQGLRLEWIEYG